MNHNYGLPYKGSKNTIAERVVRLFPSGGRFLDACCGGGAISHAAYLSGGYASVTGCDINKSMITLLRAVMLEGGKIDYEHFKLVKYEDYYEAKTRWDDGNLEDALIRYTSSFGYNGMDYLWGKGRLQIKYLMQEVVSKPTLFERREAMRCFINLLDELRIEYGSNEFKNMAHMEQLESLQRIKMVEDEMSLARDSIATELDFRVSSMFDIDFESYDVIYFDPPYRSAKHLYNKIPFSSIMFNALLQALIKAGRKVFVSEYECPCEGFTEIANFRKQSTQSAQVNKFAIERVYFGGTKEEYEQLTGNKVEVSKQDQDGNAGTDDSICDDSPQ